MLKTNSIEKGGRGVRKGGLGLKNDVITTCNAINSRPSQQF